MRSTKSEEKLLDAVSSSNTMKTNDKIMSKERIVGSNDSVPSTHCSDEESYPVENGVEIVSIRRVFSNKDENEKSPNELIKERRSEPIKKESIELIKKKSIEPSKKESRKTSMTTTKQPFRGLFGSKRSKKKPPSQQTQKLAASTKKSPTTQSQKTKREAAPTMEAISPGPSSLLKQISISVVLRREIDHEVESLKADPEKEATTFVGAIGAENEDDREDVPLLQRIVRASDLPEVPAPDSIGGEEAPASAKAGEMSAKSDPSLSTVENTEAQAGDFSAKSDPNLSTVKGTEAQAGDVPAKSVPVLSTVENAEAKAEEVSAKSNPILITAPSNETVENEADGTTSSVATAAAERNSPIVIEKVAPTARKANILDSAGVKVDALVDAFFLMTSCGRIDTACYGLDTDPSCDGDTSRRILSDDGDTLRSDADDDTFQTFDNSLIEDDETLRTFLEEDGTLCADDDTVGLSEDVKRAIDTLKRCASRLGVSEAELLQRIRDEQENRMNENKKVSPPTDET